VLALLPLLASRLLYFVRSGCSGTKDYLTRILNWGNRGIRAAIDDQVVPAETLDDVLFTTLALYCGLSRATLVVSLPSNFWLVLEEALANGVRVVVTGLAE
jgi:hypothetical protein